MLGVRFICSKHTQAQADLLCPQLALHGDNLCADHVLMDGGVLQVNLSPDNYLFRMNDVSRELYIVAGGVVELLIEQEDQSEITESVRSAGQVSVAAFAQSDSLAGGSVALCR